ncbi:MAG: MurR/RpiR family transcriptional regulator [Clostridia bacterium]|nr:MurR/RpiR family transcriptional regulator [Clostridia bacterium]
MEKKLLHELRSTVEFMSSAERKIAKVLLADPERFTKYSLSELAQISGVAQGSIINFSRKYSGGGFPELKLAVAQALMQETERPFSTVESRDSMKTVLQKTADGIYQGLQNTVTLNDAAALESACRMILRARKIEIYGIFRSAVVATDMYYQLIQLGLPANFVSDVLTCAVSASLLNESSLVVAISYSGQTRDVIDAVKLAKSNGAPIIAITAHKDSPLAALADTVLLACPAGNALSETANQVRMSQLAIVDALVSELRNMNESEGKSRYFRISEILGMHNVKD